MRKGEAWLTLALFLLILFIPQYGVIAAFVLLCVYLRRSQDRKAVLSSLGFKSPTNWAKTSAFCLLLGVVLEVSSQVVVTPVLERLTTSHLELTALAPLRGHLGPYLWWLGMGWVVGGLLEETLFRGFLLTRVAVFVGRGSFGKLLGLLSTSLAFGLCHLYQGWSGVFSTSLMGAVFGLLFLRARRNLWYTILTHGFVNMTGLTLLFFKLDTKLQAVFF